MMTFIFPPHIQAGIAAGIYKQVISKSGIPLSMVQGLDGRIAGHAVGSILNDQALPELISNIGGAVLKDVINGSPVSPLIGGFQIIQTHRGFQKTYAILNNLQASVGVLQATTALIGVGTVVGVALTAVNLYQTMKLREDVKQLKLEVVNGFIDLKQALKDQNKMVLQRIDEVAEDIEFKQHHVVLAQAYGHFVQGVNCLRDAAKLQDLGQRNAQIDLAKGMLFHALAAYDNPQLLEDASSAGILRRRECSWAIEQAIALAYESQNAHELVSDRISQLQQKIRKDILTVAERCESEEELDFIFPEIVRIYMHDLAALRSWQGHAEWRQSLSPEEYKNLSDTEFLASEESATSQEVSVIDQPVEQSLYDIAKSKSHFLALRDQLKFLIKPDLRQAHEAYISQQALASGQKSLAPANWQEVPDLTVANLYWYFKSRSAQA
jgi:hypothetical protein